MEKCFWVYLMSDRAYGTLYTGFINDLSRRIYEHKNGLYKGFTAKYGLKMLVYHVQYPTALEGIRREKCIKKPKSRMENSQSYPCAKSQVA